MLCQSEALTNLASVCPRWTDVPSAWNRGESVKISAQRATLPIKIANNGLWFNSF